MLLILCILMCFRMQFFRVVRGRGGGVTVVRTGDMPDELGCLALAEVCGLERHESSVRVSAN